MDQQSGIVELMEKMEQGMRQKLQENLILSQQVVQQQQQNASLQSTLQQTKEQLERKTKQVQELEEFVEKERSKNKQVSGLLDTLRSWEEFGTNFEIKLLNANVHMEQVLLQMLSSVNQFQKNTEVHIISKYEEILSKYETAFYHLVTKWRQIQEENKQILVENENLKKQMDQKDRLLLQLKQESSTKERSFNENLHKTKLKFQEKIIQLTTQVERNASGLLLRDQVDQLKINYETQIAALQKQITELTSNH